VLASEEQALRRVEEKKRTARRDAASAPDPRRKLRDARLRVERAEREVALLEQEVNEATRALDDPGLYTKVSGVAEARRLGARLDSLRSRLDEALVAWERETAALETLERAMVS
jgi:hypothetical protein